MKILNSYIVYKALYSYMFAKILKNLIHILIAQCKLPFCCFTSTPILIITILR